MQNLQTDLADHNATIDIHNELAWVIDRKTLAQHRMKRTPVKLQCYAVSKDTGVRELVGYVMLDLRTAQQANPRPSWFPLLSTKYGKTRPELKLLITIELGGASAGAAGDPEEPPRLTGFESTRHDLEPRAQPESEMPPGPMGTPRLEPAVAGTVDGAQAELLEARSKLDALVRAENLLLGNDAVPSTAGLASSEQPGVPARLAWIGFAISMA